MAASPRSFILVLREEHFAEVKENLEIGAKRPLSDEDVTTFLRRHPDILGSIVKHDEVDTTDRARIWEEQRVDELVG